MGYRSVYKDEFDVNFDKHVKRLFRDLAVKCGLVSDGMDISICHVLKDKFQKTENDKHRSPVLPTNSLDIDIKTLRNAFGGAASDQTYDVLTKWLYDRNEVSFRLHCLDEEIKEILPKTILDEVRYGDSLWGTNWKSYHNDIIKKLVDTYPSRGLKLDVTPFESSLCQRLLKDLNFINNDIDLHHISAENFITYINNRKISNRKIDTLSIAALGSQVSGLAILNYIKAYLKLKRKLNNDILISDYYHSSALYHDLLWENNEFDFIVLPYHAYNKMSLKIKKTYLPLCAMPSNDVPVYCSKATQGLFTKLKEIPVLTQDGSTHVSQFLELPLQQVYKTTIRLENMEITDALRKLKEEPDEPRLVILFGRFGVTAKKIPGLLEEPCYKEHKLEFFNFIFYNQERFSNGNALKDFVILIQSVRLLFSQDCNERERAVNLLLSDLSFREKTLAVMDHKCHDLLYR